MSQKYQENNTAKNKNLPTPKKIKTKLGFSPKSFYKSSKDQGAKISKLINDANNSFSLKRNRSKCDLNPKLNQDVSLCNKYKKKSSDLNTSQNKCNIVVSKQAPNTNKGISENRKEKISNNANQKSFSEAIVKGCEVEKLKRTHDHARLQHLPHSVTESSLNQNGTARNFGEIPPSTNKHNCKRRASEADLEDDRRSKHSKQKSHKRSKSSTSRRRNDIKHILTNYQNRLLQQRHQDHQATSPPSINVSSPVKNSSMCNIIKPAKLTNVVTPTKFSSVPAQIPIQVQQTIVKSSKSQSIIMLPNSFPTQQINTAFNKQMIIVPSPNNMGSQLPAFYHHQSEVRTSFTSNIIVPSSSINPNNSTRNNPFLPPSEIKSSFLFGNNDEFETADGDDFSLDDEVILAMGSESSSEASDDEEDDHIIYSPINDDRISLEEDRIIPKLPKTFSSSNTDQLLPNNTSIKTSHTICQRDLHSNVTCKEKKELKSTTMNGPMMQMNGKDINLYEKGSLKNVDIKVEKDGIHTNNKVSAKDGDNVSNKKIRFPAMQGPTNMIECKWLDCQMSFTTYGRLSDHLKVMNIL